MKGNQVILNSLILEHPKNVINKKKKDKEPLDIIYAITDEYWKEWRRAMTFAEKPYIAAPGLGYYSMMYGKSKSYLRKLIRKIRSLREKNPVEYLQEGTRSYSIHQYYLKRFRATWKQVDMIKKDVNKLNTYWTQKRILKQQKLDKTNE